LDWFTFLEASQVAGNDIAGSAQLGNALAHRFERHSRGLRDFRVESRTVFLQVLEDLSQGGYLGKKGSDCIRATV